MSETVAAILNRYDDASRYVAQPYADHWVVVDTVTERTVHSYMHWDAEAKALSYAAKRNGLLT